MDLRTGRSEERAPPSRRLPNLIAPFTSRRCRAQAGAAAPSPFGSRPMPGSGGRPRSRHRSRPWIGPNARRRAHCTWPRSSARQGMRSGARRQTTRPQIQRPVSPHTAPAHTANVNSSDSPLCHREVTASLEASSLIVGSAGETGEAVVKPQRSALVAVRFRNALLFRDR